jgi:poly-gamma-glutamate biosynthesis protein PgsC/CapC
METIYVQSIGLGLAVSLFFSESLGLAAGGMVVPGYLALMIHHPLRILGTILVSLATLGGLQLLSRFMIIYGRRRIVYTVLLGFVFGWLSRELLVLRVSNLPIEMQTIGYILPGLIASWMERQGVIPTICVMLVTAVLVRMALMVLTGGQVLP